MLKLLVLTLIVLFMFHTNTMGQSVNPHGDLKIECSVCHSDFSWEYNKKSSFDHNDIGYRLSGQHKDVACSSCHQDLVFGNVGIACADCHQDIHNGEQGVSCQDCHTPANWDNRLVMFSAHEQTRFSLTGAHFGLDCEACHILAPKREYANLPVDCQSCHLQEYENTENPDHSAVGFSINCADCHSIADRLWSSSSFDHNVTAFPLRGMHAVISCEDCHAGNYGKIPGDCVDCHREEYDNSSDPDHAGFQFSTACETCHGENSWQPAPKFDHTAESGFPLTGAHVFTPCIECHVNFQLSGIPNDCYGCHQNQYETAADPDHTGFPTTCETCHSTTNWVPADFDHNLTIFPLTGAHVSLECFACHESGYTGTPTDCFSCHQTDFDNTNDPNHAAALFPTECETCHTTTAWEPANWDHDTQYFPIYTGAHNEKWDTCDECHTSPSNYSIFDCITCHEHNQTDMDEKHKDENDYVYQSSACFDCHPNGKSGDDKMGIPNQLDRIR